MGQDCNYLGRPIEMLLEAALLGATLLGLGYWWLCGKWNYWKEQGIPGPTPSLPAGNFGAIMSMKVHVLDWFKDLYRQFPDQEVMASTLCINLLWWSKTLTWLVKSLSRTSTISLIGTRKRTCQKLFLARLTLIGWSR